MSWVYNELGEIDIEVEGVIWEVNINRLKYDGWIKKFTEVQEITQDYLILFTD